jgi:(S)-2-hydroxy-acid oxidase
MAKLPLPDIAMTSSSYSTKSLEDLKAQDAQNPYAIELCVLRDRYGNKQIVGRAEAA